MDWKLLYWQFFNFFVRKIVGVSFIIFGVLFTAWSLYDLFAKNKINVNMVETDDIPMKLMFLCVALVFSVIGMMLFRVDPYYPPGIKKEQKRHLTKK